MIVKILHKVFILLLLFKPSIVILPHVSKSWTHQISAGWSPGMSDLDTKWARFDSASKNIYWNVTWKVADLSPFYSQITTSGWHYENVIIIGSSIVQFVVKVCPILCPNLPHFKANCKMPVFPLAIDRPFQITKRRWSLESLYLEG